MKIDVALNMRHCLLLLLLHLTGAVTDPCTAQQYILKSYTVNDGLVANNIRRVFQDSKGFLWIATWEGLSRYDGHQFTNYTTGNGLKHELVNDICETKDGNIYIACNDGSLHLVKGNEMPRDITAHKIIINRFRRLPGDKIIACSDNDGIYEFNDGMLAKPRQAHPGYYYYDIAPFNDSLLIARSDYTLELFSYRYDFFSERREPFKYFVNSSLFTDSKKRTWLGALDGLKLLSPSQEKGKPVRFLEPPPAFRLPLLKSNPISVVFEDGEGNMWIGTYHNGLIKIGPEGSPEYISEKNGLPAADITCIFQDREKNLWIGTSLGIVKLVSKNNIRTYTVEDGLLSNNVSIVFPFSADTIIVESTKGLQYFDRARNLFSNAPAEKNYYGDNDPNNTLSLLRDRKNKRRYAAYFQKPLIRFSFGPNWSANYYAYKDHYGNFFSAGTMGPMVSRDIENWENVFFDLDTRAILIDSKNYLWIGTFNKGLYRIRYDFVRDSLRLGSEEHFFPGIGIRSLFEDSKGNTWVGTRHNGIYCISPGLEDPQVIQHYDQSTGLTSNRIVAIGEDKTGSVWVSFYQGLDKLIPEKNRYRIFNFSRYNNFFANIQGIIFDKDYSLWLGTTKGLVHISDGLLENETPLQTYITGARLGDSLYRNYNDKKINLSYRQKKVQFEFAAPGFINEKQVLYSYRLMGSNTDEWTQASNEHKVSYASMKPGEYRFEVRSLGWNGIWGEPAVFEFSIAPPFWQTWWFRATCALIIVASTIWLVRRRIQHIRREAGLKHRMADAEMAALRSQMNPHFIFNCLNAIDNLIQTNQKEKATVYLSRFAKLIRNVLDSSKNNVVPFQKDQESLRLYLEMEQFRCSNRFDYTLSADEELLLGDLKVPPLILQPFVENAIHHGLLNKDSNDRMLEVKAEMKEGYIQYTVTDNGIGRLRAEQLKQINKPGHQSYGIQITEERLRLYNRQHNAATGDVIITDLYEAGKPSGTKVEVRLNIMDNN